MPDKKITSMDKVMLDMRDNIRDPNAGHPGTNTLKPNVPRTPPSGGSGVTKDTPPPPKTDKA
jgi:hypothetical protein